MDTKQNQYAVPEDHLPGNLTLEKAQADYQEILKLNFKTQSRILTCYRNLDGYFRGLSIQTGVDKAELITRFYGYESNPALAKQVVDNVKMFSNGVDFFIG